MIFSNLIARKATLSPDFPVFSEPLPSGKRKNSLFLVTLCQKSFQILSVKSLNKSKAVKKLSALSAGQLRRFRKFLRSPYFNTNRRLLRYFDFLRQRLPAAHAPGLSPEAAYRYVYPDRPFNKNGLKMLGTKLLGLLKDFLRHEAVEGERPSSSIHDGLTHGLALARHYGETGQYPELAKLRASLKEGEGQPLDEDHFLKLFLIEKEIHKARTTQRPGSALFRAVNYPEVIQALERAYAIQKLIYFCQMANYYTGTRQALPFAIDEESLPRPEFTPREAIVYDTWMAALKFIKGEGLYFQAIRQQLLAHPGLFSNNDKRNLCGYLQNFIVRSGALNRYEKYTNLLELLQFQARHEVFHDFNLTAGIFWVMTAISATLGQMDWLDEGVLARARKFRDGSYQVFLAKKRLLEGQFGRAEKLLDTAEAIIGNIDGQVQALKMALVLSLKNQIYYDSGEHGRFHHGVNRFKTFLSSGRKFYRLIPPQRRDIVDGNRAFNNLCAQLLRFNEAAALKKERIKNYHKIAARLYVPDKDVYQEEWLQQKVEALLPGNIYEPLFRERELLKNQFELAPGGAFNRSLDGYLQLLDSVGQPLHPNHRRAVENFVRYLRRLHPLKEAPSTDALRELESAICREGLLQERAWLLRSVFHLKNSIPAGSPAMH